MPNQIDENAMKAKEKGNQTFDIHKPPLKHLPHQEYPKMLYLWPKDKKLSPTSKTAVAKNADEEATLKAKGYRDKPHVQEFEEELPEGFEADTGDEEEAATTLKAVEDMTKAELLAHAKDVHGLELDPTLKKGDILQAIQAKAN